MRITVLPGDGVGPEVTAEAVRVVQTIAGIQGHRIEFEEHPIGGVAIRESGSPLPRTTLDACLASDAVLLGAVGSPEYDRLPPHQRPEAGLLLLRRALGGYANLRPAIFYPAIAACSPLRPEVSRGTDILIVRELLGGLYFGEPRGFSGTTGMTAAVNTMRYSVEEIERVAHVAFESAKRRRGKVTSVDKANVLETSQLWRQTVTRVAENYPEVELDHLYVDACAMHLITNPRRFDVVLTENLFGDILSDEAAVITGSLGMLASATVLFRHTANLEQEASDIEQAIELVLEAGYRTPDIAGDTSGYVVSTAEIGQLVLEAVAEVIDMRHAYHAV